METMSLVVLEGVGLSYGKKTIVADLGLRIADGDRIGVVGPNGSGKTTLMRLIAGQQAPDVGEVRTSRGLRIGYLPQDLVLNDERGLLAFVLESVPGRSDLEARIAAATEELEAVIAERPDSEEAMAAVERLSAMHEEQSHLDLHYTEHEALKILNGLGFRANESQRPVSELSGGWKMRAVLASLLFQRPDVLLLDEPTNHLDMPSVAWFGAFLKTHRGGFLMICHDREFLNEQITRVVSFESEGVRSYQGNYDSYQKQRAEERTILANQAKNMAKKREQTQEFIDRFRAKASKASAVQSRVRQLEKMEDVALHQDRAVIRIRFPPTKRPGNEVLRVDDVSHSFGEHRVLEHVSITVPVGERVGIIGVNGAGKTTLLKIMAGELSPSSGKVALGHNVDLGYYAQHHTDTLNGNNTVYDEVAQYGKDVGMTQVRTLLGAFLFHGDDVDKKIRVLSGGERARVALARMLIHPGNVMLMDEPTNHLDLDSSEALAEALAQYDGSVVFVSHNRSFVRRLATQIWNVEDGHVEIYPGTLDEYLERCQRLAAEGREGASAAPTAMRTEGGGKGPSSAADLRGANQVSGRSRETSRERKRREAEIRNQRSKRIGPLARRSKELEVRIAQLEEEQRERNSLLEDPAVFGDDQRRFPILASLQTAAEKIEELTARWMGVQEEIETIEAELAAEEALLDS